MNYGEVTDQDEPVLYYIASNGAVQNAKTVYAQFSGFSANHSFLQNVFQGNGKTTVLGYYYGDNAEESHFIISFKPTDSIVTANFIAHNNFSLQRYVMRTKAIATNQKLLSNVFLNKDYSLLVASSSVYTGQRNNIFLSKYDSLGRICPTNNLPAVDSSVKKYKYVLRTTPYALVNDYVYLDTITYATRNTGNETDICSGSSIQNSIDKTATKINIAIAPNPAKNIITVDFVLPNTSTIQFNISSSTGKLWITQIKTLPACKLHELLNISTLPPGLYFLKTTINSRQYIKSFLKE